MCSWRDNREKPYLFFSIEEKHLREQKSGDRKEKRKDYASRPGKEREKRNIEERIYYYLSPQREKKEKRDFCATSEREEKKKCVGRAGSGR